MQPHPKPQPPGRRGSGSGAGASVNTARSSMVPPTSAREEGAAAAEAMSVDLVRALYDTRLSNITNQMRETLLTRVTSDGVLKTLLAEPSTADFSSQRVEEVLNEVLVAEREATIAKLSEAVAGKEVELRALQRIAQTRETAMSTLQGQLESTLAQLSREREAAAAMQAQANKAVQAANQGKEAANNTANQRLAQVHAAEVARTTAEAAVAAMHLQLEEVEARLRSFIDRCAALERENATTAADRDKQRAKAAECSAREVAANTRLSRLQEENLVLRSSHVAAEQRAVEAQTAANRIPELDASLASLQKEKDALSAKLSEAVRVAARSQSRLDEARAQRGQLEKEKAEVNALLSSKDEKMAGLQAEMVEAASKMERVHRETFNAEAEKRKAAEAKAAELLVTLNQALDDAREYAQAALYAAQEKDAIEAALKKEHRKEVEVLMRKSEAEQDALRRGLQEAEEKNESLGEQLRLAVKSKSELEITLSAAWESKRRELVSRVAALEDDLARRNDSLEQATQSKQELEQREARLQQQLRAKESALSQQQEQLSDSERRLMAADQDLTAAVARSKELEELAAELHFKREEDGTNFRIEIAELEQRCKQIAFDHEEARRLWEEEQLALESQLAARHAETIAALQAEGGATLRKAEARLAQEKELALSEAVRKASEPLQAEISRLERELQERAAAQEAASLRLQQSLQESQDEHKHKVQPPAEAPPASVQSVPSEALEAAEARTKEAEQARDEAKAKAAALEDELASLSGLKDALLQKNRSAAAAIEEADNHISALEKELSELKGRLEAKESQVAAAKKEAEEARAAAETAIVTAKAEAERQLASAAASVVLPSEHKSSQTAADEEEEEKMKKEEEEKERASALVIRNLEIRLEEATARRQEAESRIEEATASSLASLSAREREADLLREELRATQQALQAAEEALRAADSGARESLQAAEAAREAVENKARESLEAAEAARHAAEDKVRETREAMEASIASACAQLREERDAATADADAARGALAAMRSRLQELESVLSSAASQGKGLESLADDFTKTRAGLRSAEEENGLLRSQLQAALSDLTAKEGDLERASLDHATALASMSSQLKAVKERAKEALDQKAEALRQANRYQRAASTAQKNLQALLGLLLSSSSSPSSASPAVSAHLAGGPFTIIGEHEAAVKEAITAAADATSEALRLASQEMLLHPASSNGNPNNHNQSDAESTTTADPSMLSSSSSSSSAVVASVPRIKRAAGKEVLIGNTDGRGAFVATTPKRQGQRQGQQQQGQTPVVEATPRSSSSSSSSIPSTPMGAALHRSQGNFQRALEGIKASLEKIRATTTMATTTMPTAAMGGTAESGSGDEKRAEPTGSSATATTVVGVEEAARRATEFAAASLRATDARIREALDSLTSQAAAKQSSGAGAAGEQDASQRFAEITSLVQSLAASHAEEVGHLQSLVLTLRSRVSELESELRLSRKEHESKLTLLDSSSVDKLRDQCERVRREVEATFQAQLAAEKARSDKAVNKLKGLRAELLKMAHEADAKISQEVAARTAAEAALSALEKKLAESRSKRHALQSKCEELAAALRLTTATLKKAESKGISLVNTSERSEKEAAELRRILDRTMATLGVGGGSSSSSSAASSRRGSVAGAGVGHEAEEAAASSDPLNDSLASATRLNALTQRLSAYVHAAASSESGSAGLGRSARHHRATKAKGKAEAAERPSSAELLAATSAFVEPIGTSATPAQARSSPSKARHQKILLATPPRSAATAAEEEEGKLQRKGRER